MSTDGWDCKLCATGSNVDTCRCDADNTITGRLRGSSCSKWRKNHVFSVFIIAMTLKFKLETDSYLIWGWGEQTKKQQKKLSIIINILDIYTTDGKGKLFFDSKFLFSFCSSLRGHFLCH